MTSYVPPAGFTGSEQTEHDETMELQDTSKTVDIGSVVDDGRFTTFQKLIVFLAALSIIVDGFDSQLIGFAIPVLIKEWGIARNAFAPVVAAGLVGMGIGSACAGLFADRFGRRWAGIGRLGVFGVAACAISRAHNNPVNTDHRFTA